MGILKDLENIDWDLLELSKERKIVKLLYKSSEFKIQTCMLSNPFNVNSYLNKYTNYYDYTIDCQILNNDKSEHFRSFMQELPEVLDEIINEDNDNIYFPEDKKFPMKQILKQPNPKYPMSFRIKLPRDSKGNFLSIAFINGEKTMITEDNIRDIFQPKSQFRCSLIFQKVWSFNNEMGVVINLDQIKFKKQEKINENLDSDGPITECLLQE